MKASILDLRRKMKDILKSLDRNETVTILYRGKERAVLCPLENSESSIKSLRNHPAIGMWRNREDMKDVDEYIKNLRKGRLGDIGH